MPYITKEDRERIQSIQDNLLCEIATAVRNTQDLRYVIAGLAHTYLSQQSVEMKSVTKRILQMRDEVVSSNTIPFLSDRMRSFLLEFSSDKVGEYNYMITYVIHIYLQLTVGMSYTNINQVIGALEKVKLDFQDVLSGMRVNDPITTIFDHFFGILVCVQMELYHMVARPYENLKLKENGAISELDAIHEKDLKQYGRPHQIM